MLEIFSRYAPLFGAAIENSPFSLVTPPVTKVLSVVSSCTVVCTIGSLVSLSTRRPVIVLFCAIAVIVVTANSANKIIFFMCGFGDCGLNAVGWFSKIIDGEISIWFNYDMKKSTFLMFQL